MARFRTIVDVSRHWAVERPQQPAFSFLANGEEEAVRWTYGELDHRARQVAVALLERARPGERVLLLYPPGIEFVAGFLGCLYGGFVPVPAYPPAPNHPPERLLKLVEDARPAVT